MQSCVVCCFRLCHKGPTRSCRKVYYKQPEAVIIARSRHGSVCSRSTEVVATVRSGGLRNAVAGHAVF